jgi:hypothetical protein
MFVYSVGCGANFTIERWIQPDELLAHVLDAAAHVKKREDQLRRTTRHLRTGFAKWFDIHGEIFEHLL